jgi:transmembrane sensor
LRGEAYFTVVHDARTPFIVQTAHARVEDIGTVFVVHAYADETEERVAVEQGEVRVGATSLTSRDVAVVDATGALSIRHGADLAPYVAWSQGRLVFDATPFPEVVRQLDRAFDLDITLADSTLARDAVTAAFANESADQVLSAVTQALGASYQRHGRVVVITRRRRAIAPHAAGGSST